MRCAGVIATGLLGVALSGGQVAAAPSTASCAAPFNPNNALLCYDWLQNQPPSNGKVTYQNTGTVPILLVQKTTYKMDYAQSWPSQSQDYLKGVLVDPSKAKWQHTISVYMPDKVNDRKNAIIYLDGGSLYSYDNDAAKADAAADNEDFDWIRKGLVEWARQRNAAKGAASRNTGNAAGKDDIGEDLAFATLAEATSTPVVWVQYVPNQPLQMVGSPNTVRESELMAQTWRMFMANPTGGGTDAGSSMPRNQALPINIGMGESVVATTKLLAAEYGGKISSVILSGGSKRALAAWMGALADTSLPVTGLVPMAYDLLNSRDVLRHERSVYGGQWPIDLQPFVDNRIFADIDDPSPSSRFNQLAQSADPLAYAGNPAYKGKLNIPIVVVNASSDGFFAPDNPSFYMPELLKQGGNKMLYTLPNGNHGGNNGIDVSAVAPILIAIVDRINQGKQFPLVSSNLTGMMAGGNGGTFKLDVQFDQVSDVKSATLYTATNPRGDRDFRMDCGIQYKKTDINPAEARSGRISRTFQADGGNYTAAFIEVEYQDGLQASSITQVFPPTMPSKIPWTDGKKCRTMPDVK